MKCMAGFGFGFFWGGFRFIGFRGLGFIVPNEE